MRYCIWTRGETVPQRALRHRKHNGFMTQAPSRWFLCGRTKSSSWGSGSLQGARSCPPNTAATTKHYHLHGTHTVDGEGATAGLDRSGTRVEPDMVVQAPRPVWVPGYGPVPYPIPFASHVWRGLRCRRRSGRCCGDGGHTRGKSRCVRGTERDVACVGIRCGSAGGGDGLRYPRMQHPLATARRHPIATPR